MSAKSFYESVKLTYVQVARDEFGINGKAATTSRIAILTGLTRKEVQALLDVPIHREERYGDEYNRAARVITGWLRDPDFGDGSGHPLPLRMEGKQLSFRALVKRYSGDIPERAMLDELVRVGSCKAIKRWTYRARYSGLYPSKGHGSKIGDPRAGYR